MKTPSSLLLALTLITSPFLHAEDEIPSLDYTIASEVVDVSETEQQQAIVFETEEESLDIDSLIMEAENAMKEEIIEEKLASEHEKPQLFIRYNEEDKVVLSNQPNNPAELLDEAQPNLEVAAKVLPKKNSVEQPISLPRIESGFTFEEIVIDEPNAEDVVLQKSNTPVQEEVSAFAISLQLEHTDADKISLSAFTPTAVGIEVSAESLPVDVSAPELGSNNVVIEKKASSLPSFNITQKQPEAVVALQEKHAFPVYKTSPFNIQKVFSEAPIVYTMLLFLSITTFALILYQWLYFRPSQLLPRSLLSDIRFKIQSQQYMEARSFCLQQESFFFKIIASGLTAKEQSLYEVIEAMKHETKKQAAPLWQKLSFLNYIAFLAPMLGLFGTVLGLYHTFSETSPPSSFFEGLSQSFGPTAAGLFVAILVLGLQALAKYRLMKLLSRAEAESESFAKLIKSTALLDS